MKIAIVHDELVRKGGAEQVVLSFHKAFPDAPIYTLTYNAEETYPEFKSCKVKTSWFGRFIKNDKNLKRFFVPFGVLAMKQLKVTGYDVVLQSTTHCSKYVQVEENTLVLTYCHTPFRLVFRPDSYDAVANANIFKRVAYNFVINMLRKIDVAAAKRTDWFIANAREVVPRIMAAYKPEHAVTVINPPVKCRNFFVSENKGDYFLVVSRFEPYKKVDLVVDVFNKLPNQKLMIVGSGSMEDELKSKAGSNIFFMTSVSAEKLAHIYSNAKALIFPQHEDYGITPLEAAASGRPVIAYGHGGVLDTMIPVSEGIGADKATAVFFDKQTTESLNRALRLFETLSFNPSFIRAHAEKYDEPVFINRLQEFVSSKYSSRFLTTPNKCREKETVEY